MRLSEWRAAAPHRDAMAAKVLAVVDPLLATLGCDPDPHAWVAWGDDPAIRYSIFVPTSGGLVVSHVRVNVAGEGPRASAKVVRWNRVQLGELSVETQGAHRMVTFQVEQQVLRGADTEADRVAAFALALFAGADGRPLPDLGALPRGRRPSRAGTAKAASTKPRPAKAASAKAPAAGASRAGRSAARRG